jgi:hypothetical protein
MILKCDFIAGRHELSLTIEKRARFVKNLIERRHELRRLRALADPA